MKIQKRINKKNDKLLLFFSGWSASPDVFGKLESGQDTDLWICYDYRDLSFPEDISSYKEITLIAWSLGVWVASLLFDGKETFFAKAIAINGTPCPVHDRSGIPEIVFRGTLENIDEEGLHRFNRRMCGNRETLLQYEQYPSREIKEIEEELNHLFQQIQEKGNGSCNLWTQAVLSVSDRIFPFENLRHYWKGRCPVTEINAPHYPFNLWKEWKEIYK